MAKIWTIAKREYKQYFYSPAAYVVAAIILYVVGRIFRASIETSIMAAYQGGQYTPGVADVLNVLVFMLVFTIPAITMRVISEEQRMGTIELLLTSPVRDWELIVGKWLGAFLFVLSIIGLTLVYPIIMHNMIDTGIDQGPLLSGYFGVMLLAGAFVAIGVAISSFFSNQVASFVATMGIFMILWFLIGVPDQLAGSFTGNLLRFLDARAHFVNTFLQGTIDLTDVVYFSSIIWLFLLIGSVSLEFRRWK